MGSKSLEKLAKEFGGELLVRVEDTLRDEWERLPPDALDAVQDAAVDLAELTIRSLAGEDVDEEIAHCRAQRANWTFVGASRAHAALMASLQEAAVVIGKIVLKLVV